MFRSNEDYDKLDAEDVLKIADVPNAVKKSTIQVENITKGYTFEVGIEISDYDRDVIHDGGALNYLRNKINSKTNS